jgi:hypothetical protein
MHKLLVLRGMVIEDIDKFIDSYIEGDDEEAKVLRKVYRQLEKEWPHYVIVIDLEELTDEEEEKLLHCMIAAGGFNIESLGIYTNH